VSVKYCYECGRGVVNIHLCFSRMVLISGSFWSGMIIEDKGEAMVRCFEVLVLLQMYLFMSRRLYLYVEMTDRVVRV
jgi:hypothetical protein